MKMKEFGPGGSTRPWRTPWIPQCESERTGCVLVGCARDAQRPDVTHIRVLVHPALECLRGVLCPSEQDGVGVGLLIERLEDHLLQRQEFRVHVVLT